MAWCWPAGSWTCCRAGWHWWSVTYGPLCWPNATDGKKKGRHQSRTLFFFLNIQIFPLHTLHGTFLHLMLWNLNKVNPSIHLFIHSPFFNPSLHLLINPSNPLHPSIYKFTFRSINSSFDSPIYSLHQLSIHPSTYSYSTMSIHPFINPFICSSIHSPTNPIFNSSFKHLSVHPHSH